jgi:hypothetical protein
MPAKASAGTEVIPLFERSRLPPCVGQEPDRTSGAPSESPLKLHPPNPTVQGKAEALLDAASSPSSASKLALPLVIPMPRTRPRCLVVKSSPRGLSLFLLVGKSLLWGLLLSFCTVKNNAADHGRFCASLKPVTMLLDAGLLKIYMPAP